jgi:hypothetical protein
MTSDELLRANGLADVLIAKLEWIKARWEDILSEKQAEDLAKSTSAIASALEPIKETWTSSELPCIVGW